MMEPNNGKKKKKNQKESELNEVEESKKLKTLEKEGRIETSNGQKNKKKMKESELEEAHKELVEYEDGTKFETLEKESMIELNNDKKKKKKNKKKENVSEDIDKEVTNSEECKGKNKRKGISTLEDDTMIEPENNDKIKKQINKQDVELTENKVSKSEVIIDTSNNERNNKKKKNMKDNKESTIDDDFRCSSKQSVDREAIEGNRKKKDEKKLDNKVSHLDKKFESSVENKKKNKLPRLDEEQTSLSTKKKRKMIGDIEGVESSSTRKKKRKIGDVSEGESGNKKKSNKENNDMAEKDASEAKNKKINVESSNSKPKRVSFSGNVEVFPMNKDDSTEKVCYEKNGDGSSESIYNEENNFAGKRFSPYEDQLIRDAVQKYIDINQLGEDGIEKIINSGSIPGVKGCWVEISKDLPWRSHIQVYVRGRLILQMSENAEKRGFSKEDIKKILDFHAQNGPKWNELARDLNKSRLHIKDAYRRRRLLQTLKKGKWSQDEYQNLFDLVHQNICAKIYEKNKNKNPMTRDGIAWETISEKLKTRAMADCCLKWYNSLSSPLVREQKWSDADDYRLLDALYHQEGCCEEDVDWDNLVETRPGEICQKRWEEMVRHIGEYKERTFRDQINLLKERYDINMLKYVEALKNKNRADESDDEEENEDEYDPDKDRKEE